MKINHKIKATENPCNVNTLKVLISFSFSVNADWRELLMKKFYCFINHDSISNSITYSYKGFFF